MAEVFAARTGLQDYMGREVDPENAHGLRDQAMVQVYRPESEVFKTDSLATYADAPVTIDHPTEQVDAGNWKRLGVGETGNDIARDGQKIRVPLIVRDAEGVRKATTTHRQVSMGYQTKLIFPTDGKHPDGTPCQAYQTDIRINHLAFVPSARGGAELRIIDERTTPETSKMKITIGDAKDVDLSDGAAVALAVGALNTKLTTQDTQIGTLTADLATANTAIQTKDGEIAGLNAKLVDAEVTPQKLQQLADARADVIGKAKTLKADIVTDGKTDAEIRKEAVTAKLADAAKDMADAAIEGAFLALTKDAKPVPAFDANAFKGGLRSVGDAAMADEDAAYQRMVGRLTGKAA